MRTVELIRRAHPGRAASKLTRGKRHCILTNETYVGVLCIYTHDKAHTQEVPAVWAPIIARTTFDRVQAALHENRERLVGQARLS